MAPVTSMLAKKSAIGALLAILSILYLWYAVENRVFFRKISDYHNNRNAFNAVANAYLNGVMPNDNDFTVMKSIGINSIFVDGYGNIEFCYPLTWVDAGNDRRAFIFYPKESHSDREKPNPMGKKYVVQISSDWVYLEY